MTASNFPACLDFTLAQEGGFVDMRDDRGGATNMGITLATLAAYRGHEVTVGELEAMTQAEAEAIYVADFWRPVNGDALPPGLDLMVFDMGVNAGPRRSAEQLQAVIGVAQDGIVGPRTLAAVQMVSPRLLIARLGYAQQVYYNGIVQASPSQSVFLAGWLARCSDRTAAAKTMALSDG